MTTKQVPGHGLCNEGAAFFNPQLPKRLNWNTTAGIGFALCTCGAQSSDLPSGASRKAWHRQHKDEMLEGK